MNPHPAGTLAESPPISKAASSQEIGPVAALDYREIFRLVCFTLSSGQLRLKPRERQLCLALALWSFGQGKGVGDMDLDRLWHHLGEEWRRNEVRRILERWRRAGWLSVDGASYRLAPDNLPGWADCFKRDGSGDSTPELPGLSSPEHLGSLLSTLSQERALAAKFSQSGQCENFAVPSAKISQSPQVPVNPGGCGKNEHCENFAADATCTRVHVFKEVPKTFTRVHGGNCENFAVELRRRVQGFVGEQDWSNRSYWNAGQSWVFKSQEDREALERALNYVEAGVQTGEVKARNRGAMLWDQFRREQAQARAGS